MDGLLVIDKPAGPTSHDVVARVRRALGERRIGHTGTLDPMASGVLPLVLGRATRLARFLSASDKSYDAVVRFGIATDTHDAEGVPLGVPSAAAALGAPLGPPRPGPTPSRDAIERALEAFRGTFLQQPPRFSAKRIGGKRSYRLARRREVRLKPDPTDVVASPAPPALPAPATVTVHAIEVVSINTDLVALRIDCSAGFYVRSLAHDLGRSLGVGGHLASLRRTRSGDLTLDEAIPLKVVESEPQRALGAIVPLGRMLPGFSAAVLTGEGVRRAQHGRVLAPEHVEKGDGSLFQTELAKTTPVPFFVRLLDPAGELVGLAEAARTPGLLHPAIILV